MKYRLLTCISLLLLMTAFCALAQDKKDKNDKDKEKDAPEINVEDRTKGGINDLEAIGARNVGCARGFGNWMSLDKQMALGKQYADQVESSAKMVTDPIINEYVNRVGQNLVRNSDAKVPFTIKVIDADEVNAFALPGGFFFVQSGLILAADTEAELAGVMAHEIAHVAACHAAREQTRGNIANLASVPLIFVGGGWGVYGAQQAAGLLVPAAFMKFSRGFESQADYLGIEYMYKSGYDPNEFITMFEKLEALEKKKPGFLAKTFASHPPTPDRVAKSQQEIAKVLPVRDQYVVSTSEFDQIKARLAALEGRHRIQDGKGDNAPGLRRTQNPDDKGKDDSKDPEDDRPKLKRQPGTPSS